MRQSLEALVSFRSNVILRDSLKELSNEAVESSSKSLKHVLNGKTVSKLAHPVFEPTKFEYDDSEEPMPVLKNAGFKNILKKIKSNHANQCNSNELQKRKREDDDFQDDEAFVKVSTCVPRKKRKIQNTENPSINYDFRNNNQVPPWLQESEMRMPENALLRLHNEIIVFYDYIKATKEENETRRKIYDLYKKIILDCFPNAKVTLFGSLRLDLCLPASDVDIAVTNVPSNAIFKIASALEYRSLTKSMEVITRARVPIIKSTLREQDISCDICFGINQEQGLEIYENVIESAPEIRILIVVLKYFFLQRKKTEAFLGDFSSHFIFLSVVALIQQTQRLVMNRVMQNQFDRELRSLRVEEEMKCFNLTNLGSLFLAYFRFYGSELNTAELSISLLKGGRLLEKKKTRSEKRRWPGWISIRNPLDETLDVGSSAYNFPRLRRKLFQDCYLQLLYAISREEKRTRQRRKKKKKQTFDVRSILSSIIVVDELIKNRAVLRESNV